MKYPYAVKIMACVVGLGLAATLVPNLAHAESVTEVIARVDAAFDSGTITLKQHADLQVSLQEALNAATELDYSAATEAYNLMAPPALVAGFDPY